MASSLHTTIETAAPKASYAANGIGFAIGAMTFNQWVMAITLLLGIATFFVNFWFQRRRDRREAEFHRARMRASARPIESDE
tara:strand:- start:282 stop:527 length:246 start_codon:yes stop_codon:yes gene_type:complete